jgi:hypothetical protein
LGGKRSVAPFQVRRRAFGLQWFCQGCHFIGAMPDVLLPALVAAAVSVLFGSASAAFLSHTLSSYRAEKEYRLKKLEDLFSAVQMWVHLKRIFYFRLSDIATGDSTGNEGTELANNAGEQAEREYSKALLIAKIYFNDLTYSMDRIRTLEDEAADTAARFITEQTDGTKYPVYDEAFGRTRGDLLDRRDAFHEKLFEEAEKVRRWDIAQWVRDKI